MSSAPSSIFPSSPSLMPLSSSRASSPFEVTVAEAPVDQTNELDTNQRRHPQYYFEDGNIVFLIEGTHYNVHRYFFARDSTHFRAILQSADTSRPCVMSDVTCADFDEFLAILYPTDFRQPTKKTTTQWTSILHLAGKWNFENIKLLAIHNLTAHATPVDKIVLGRRYGITDWLAGAYEAVCTRADPLTVEEGMKLGVEDTVRISAARQLYGTGTARYEKKYLAGDLGTIFSLEEPEERVPSIDDDANAIKIFEAQFVEAQVDYLATVRCGDPNYHAHWSSSKSACCYRQGDLHEQRRKREAVEEKERQLRDLKSRLKERRQGVVVNLACGRQDRMSWFRSS